MKENTKAISPIFATLIILAVITVLFIPVFIWATSTSNQTEDFWEFLGLVTTERIVIEEVNLKAGNTNCSVYVRNIGETSVSINDILIVSSETNDIFTYEKTKGEFASKDPVTGGILNSVIQGNLLKIEISNLNGLDFVVDELYNVQVFTTRGVGSEYEIVAK